MSAGVASLFLISSFTLPTANLDMMSTREVAYSCLRFLFSHSQGAFMARTRTRDREGER